MSVTTFYHHWVSFDILKTWQELSSQGIHWSYFCWCLYPESIWRRMIHSNAHCLWLWVLLSIVRRRVLFAIMNWFGLNLAWKKCFMQQDGGWFSFFHAGCWCSESPRQEVLSSNIRQMVLVISQLCWLVTCSVKHFSGDTGIRFARIHLKTAINPVKEISVPVLTVKALEAFVVMAHPREGIWVPDLARKERKKFQCQTQYEITLAVPSLWWGVWHPKAMQDTVKPSGLEWLKWGRTNIKTSGFCIVDLRKRCRNQ